MPCVLSPLHSNWWDRELFLAFCELQELFGLLLSDSSFSGLSEFPLVRILTITQPKIWGDVSVDLWSSLSVQWSLPPSLQYPPTNSSCLDFLKLIYHFNKVRSLGLALVFPPCTVIWKLPPGRKLIKSQTLPLLFTFCEGLQSWTICCLISENSCSTDFLWFSSCLWWEGNSCSSSSLWEKVKFLTHFNNKPAFTFCGLHSFVKKSGIHSRRRWYEDTWPLLQSQVYV